MTTTALILGWLDIAIYIASRYPIGSSQKHVIYVWILEASPR